MFKQVLKVRIPHNISVPTGIASKQTEKIFTIVSHKINSQLIRPLSIKGERVEKTLSKWDLYSAVCVERHPVIIKPMTDMEKKYQKYLRDLEFENSLKSDHELRMELDKTTAQLQKQDELLDVLDVEKQTAADFEDSCQEELNNFEFSPTNTEIDKMNAAGSLHRKLEKTLVLLVEQKIGDSLFWIPPQGVANEGETLRIAAERVFKHFCGEEVAIRFYGNAPIGVHKYKYPNALREKGVYGAKVFYFLAKYTGGQVSKNVKHQWLDQEELRKIMPADPHKAVSEFLIFN